MAGGDKELQFRMNFILPEDRIMNIARQHLNSPDESCRAVAKALFDVTTEAKTVQEALQEDRSAKLDSYLDFWFADAIEHANKLLTSSDTDARVLALCLIDMEKSVISTKESLLAEMKRTGTRPGR